MDKQTLTNKNPTDAYCCSGCLCSSVFCDMQFAVLHSFALLCHDSSGSAWCSDCYSTQSTAGGLARSVHAALRSGNAVDMVQLGIDRWGPILPFHSPSLVLFPLHFLSLSLPFLYHLIQLGGMMGRCTCSSFSSLRHFVHFPAQNASDDNNFVIYS